MLESVRYFSMLFGYLMANFGSLSRGQPYSKAFNRVWHAGPLHQLKSYGISGHIFGLTSSFLSNRGL